MLSNLTDPIADEFLETITFSEIEHHLTLQLENFLLHAEVSRIDLANAVNLHNKLLEFLRKNESVRIKRVYLCRQ